MALMKKQKKDIPTEAKTRYLSYVKKYRGGDKQPMSLYNWYHSGGIKDNYFKGMETSSEEAQLSRKNRKQFGMKD